MAAESIIIRNYAKTGIVVDELAIANRTGNVDSPDTFLQDADEKEAGYFKPVIYVNGYFVN